jgi:hypothetical protein
MSSWFGVHKHLQKWESSEWYIYCYNVPAYSALLSVKMFMNMRWASCGMACNNPVVRIIGRQ